MAPTKAREKRLPGGKVMEQTESATPSLSSIGLCHNETASAASSTQLSQNPPRCNVAQHTLEHEGHCAGSVGECSLWVLKQLSTVSPNVLRRAPTNSQVVHH